MRRSWTPGRVNLIGEWIDFNGGRVLPAALPLGVSVSLQADTGVEDAVRSAQFDGLARAGLDDPARGHWADYVFGALQAARRQGWLERGAEVQLDSEIPPGAGVSSSAAVTVGVLRAAAPADADATALAMLAQQVENEFIGMPCGIMDQMAVAHAGTGEALALDTQSLAFERLAIPQGWRFAVLHSGVERRLADGRYKARRRACLEAARQLGLDFLCDAQALDGLAAELRPVARHAASENARVSEAIAAMRAGEAHRFGDLMRRSHDSLRDDFDVSTPEIDALVADAVKAGAPGARLTGAGFGGCVVILSPEDAPEDWLDRLLAGHPAARLICEVGGRKNAEREVAR